MSVKKIVYSSWFVVHCLAFFLILPAFCYAAPCYGTKLPEKNKFFAGLQSYGLFKRYLEDNHGKISSQQEFYMMSYGLFDWLSIDLKAGAGNIKKDAAGSSEVDCSTDFAGGYGLRIKFLDRDKLKAVAGFQHISVHPKVSHVDNICNEAILDDWQWSLLGSYDFKKFTPYLGARWSRVDYIHTLGGERKRRMSDRTKSVGLIYGLDIPISQKFWLNLEGSSFDSEAFACSLNYSF